MILYLFVISRYFRAIEQSLRLRKFGTSAMTVQLSLKLARALLVVASFTHFSLAAPTGTASAAAPSSLLGYNPSNTVKNEDTDAISYTLVPGQTDTAVIGAFLDFNNVQHPQPIRGSKGGTDPGPRTEEYDVLNPDKLAPPGTDHGSVSNAQWPLGLSHMKLGLNRAGWSRQQNVDVRLVPYFAVSSMNTDLISY
jgi:hypothetical protein